MKLRLARKLRLTSSQVDVDNEPLNEVESTDTLTGVEHLSDAPSEVEQSFWNTYPVYTPNETPDEGNPNIVHEVASQNVNENVHDSPVRNPPRM